MREIKSLAKPEYIRTLKLVAGDAPEGFFLLDDEIIHLIVLLQEVREWAGYFKGDGTPVDFPMQRATLEQRGMTEKAISALFREAAWNKSVSLVELAHDAAVWPEMELKS